MLPNLKRHEKNQTGNGVDRGDVVGLPLCPNAGQRSQNGRLHQRFDGPDDAGGKNRAIEPAVGGLRCDRAAAQPGCRHQSSAGSGRRGFQHLHAGGGAEAADAAVKESRLGIPLLFGYDVIHGHKTIFPIPLALACTWNLDSIERSARIAATEASADGLNWTFSPMVDIARDPRWGRIAEGAGEILIWVRRLPGAMVRGYQGADLSRSNALMACVKHFALYGAAEAGRDYNTVDMSRHQMYQYYLPPYRAAVEAGVGSVMSSFNEVDAVPATANHWLLTDLLRAQWGFQGFVVTDYTAIKR